MLHSCHISPREWRVISRYYPRERESLKLRAPASTFVFCTYITLNSPSRRKKRILYIFFISFYFPSRVVRIIIRALCRCAKKAKFVGSISGAGWISIFFSHSLIRRRENIRGTLESLWANGLTVKSYLRPARDWNCQFLGTSENCYISRSMMLSYANYFLPRSASKIELFSAVE